MTRMYNTATGGVEEKGGVVGGTGDRGKLIPQKPCKDCGKAWSMYEDEIRFYKNLVETQQFHMPRRCPDCRNKKRQSRPKVRIPDIIAKLRKMSDFAINDEEGYTFNEDELAQDLTDLANDLELFLDQNPGLSGNREGRKYGQERQTVEEASQSGGDSKKP